MSNPAPEKQIEADITKTNRRFPCTDGTVAVLPWMAAYTLARHGIRKIRVVVANGKKYHYVKFPGEPEQSLVRWLVLDYYERKLHGDGRVHHDGSDRFLLENFSREEFERLTAESAVREQGKRERTVLTPKPGVTAERIAKQTNWLNEPELSKHAVKLLAKLTNPTDADDLFQETLVKLGDLIQNGQCEAADQKTFKHYVRTVCRNRAFDALEERRNSKLISMAGHEDKIAEDVDAVPARSTRKRDPERDYNKAAA